MSQKWIIAVGSMRRPKLNAVKDAIQAISALVAGNLSPGITGYEVASGVGHTPVTREELMRGARQRAEALQEKLRVEGSAADFYVGLEGGLDVVGENGGKSVFLESWAYVSDGQRGHFGCAGGIEIPEALAEVVLSRGTELAVAIDEYADMAGIRDGQGAWGVLTGNLISRQDSFRLAVLAAFAPFYNAKMYRVSAAASG
jgi:inosine/xanthosine triphosphatase